MTDEITTQRLEGNRAIENAAVAWVIDLERQAGRDAKDRRNQRTFPGDLESPPRIIEIKAVGGDARGADLPLEEAQFLRAHADPEHFYLYVVDNLRQGDRTKFRLRVLAGAQLQTLLQRARRKTYYELPVPVAEFDAAPSEVGG